MFGHVADKCLMNLPAPPDVADPSSLTPVLVQQAVCRTRHIAGRPCSCSFKRYWRGICGFLLFSTLMERSGPDSPKRVSRRPDGSRRFSVRSVSGFVDSAVTRLWCISNRTGCRCNVRGVDSSPADGTSERGRPFAVIKSCLRQSRQRRLSRFAAGWRRNGQPGRERFRWS
jgi:hypothetical protein